MTNFRAIAGLLDHPWNSEVHVWDTLRFLGSSGMKYYEVNLLVTAVTENAIICKDAGGVQRHIAKQDASYASWYIAQDGVGYWRVLKIRKWV